MKYRLFSIFHIGIMWRTISLTENCLLVTRLKHKSSSNIVDWVRFRFSSKCVIVEFSLTRRRLEWIAQIPNQCSVPLIANRNAKRENESRTQTLGLSVFQKNLFESKWTRILHLKLHFKAKSNGQYKSPTDWYLNLNLNIFTCTHRICFWIVWKLHPIHCVLRVDC